MNNIIDIDRHFDQGLVNYVKSQLKEIPIEEKNIIFRINSIGGNMLACEKIKGFMYFMCKYRGCKIIGQAKHAESAAFIIFLNCTVRQVAPGSVGIIHLPVANRPVSEQKMEAKKKEVIQFIMRRTKMTEQEILKEHNLPLSSAEMLKYGIATEKIPIIR